MKKKPRGLVKGEANWYQILQTFKGQEFIKKFVEDEIELINSSETMLAVKTTIYARSMDEKLKKSRKIDKEYSKEGWGLCVGYGSLRIYRLFK